MPGVIDRVEHVNAANVISDDSPDADLLRRNFWFCALDEPSGFRAADVIGVENILVESDYPHSDSTWPDTQAVLAEHLATRRSTTNAGSAGRTRSSCSATRRRRTRCPDASVSFSSRCTHPIGARLVTTEYETLLYEESDGVATITLNRPDKLNAFSPTMNRELVAAWEALRMNDDVRAIILTGAGDRAFTSGIDLTFDYPQPTSKLMINDELRYVGPKTNDLWKPVIAAVNGLVCGAASSCSARWR